MNDITADATKSAPGADVVSPEPPPMLELSAAEREVYDYICSRLREAGIEHMTAGLPIIIIVRTYSDWLVAYSKCEESGRTQIAKSGWASPTPWAEDEKRLKMELGQWLPKACLTIPSLTRVRKDVKDIGSQGQGDLFFDELAGHAGSYPQPNSRH